MFEQAEAPSSSEEGVGGWCAARRNFPFHKRCLRHRHHPPAPSSEEEGEVN
jgi:hypothetical protein